MIFQSTLPAWGATSRKRTISKCSTFQSTLPAWGATRTSSALQSSNAKFQSTLPAWGATIALGCDTQVTIFQSTLPAWGATSRMYMRYRFIKISIHAPRVGSDNIHPVTGEIELGFQSTLPAWGATAIYQAQGFSLRISIHAPRVGSDASAPGFLTTTSNFNPRSPRGERRARRDTASST